MQYAIGTLLAFTVAGFARAFGLDRERSFYPVVLTVVASYYVLFAVMGGSGNVLLAEIGMACGFAVLAITGFRRSLWLVAAALVGHGIFDLLHPFVIRNTGVPLWWPGFCLAFDGIAGTWLALLIVRQSRTQRGNNGHLPGTTRQRDSVLRLEQLEDPLLDSSVPHKI